MVRDNGDRLEEQVLYKSVARLGATEPVTTRAKHSRRQRKAESKTYI